MKTALSLFALALALSACGSDNKAELDTLDARLGGKSDADPALTAALEDQIMVDPTLSQQANEDAIRPAERPTQTPIPPEEGGPTREKPGETLGVIAAKQAELSKERFNGCLLDVEYAAGWAARLPDDLPLFPAGRVVEAAGSDNGDCNLRAVTYATGRSAAVTAKFYEVLGNRSGYRIGTTQEGAGTMVHGWRPGDGAAFYAIVQPGNGGASVDLVSNRGK